VPRARATFWTIDAETDPFHNCQDVECEKCHGGGRLPLPFLWGLYEGNSDTYLQFETVAELGKWFIDLEWKSGGQTFYAHNGGKFDYHFFRDQINADENILIISGRLAKFKVGGHEFRDSLNIFPNTRLKDFGIKSDIDYAKMEASVRHLHMAEISSYLQQDCVGLWQMIARYRRDYGKQLTQAGASMRVWQKMAQREPPRQTRGEHLAQKKYYYGGRVQCFEAGVKRTDFEVYDINSAYPFAMRNLHPISTVPSIVDNLPKRDSEIGPCLLTFNAVSHKGALPYRQESDLFFPEDEKTVRTYHVTGWEYLAALETNSLTHIKFGEILQFAEVIDFKNYIDHFFGLREDARKRGDVAGRTFGKYFMNSLYGKFGANCENYAEYVIATIDSMEDWIKKGYREYKPWGDRTLMVREPTEEELDDIQGKWRYYNIATAASVTGFVRAYLYRALCKSEGAIYCDTDSIKVRNCAHLDIGTELGKWKYEYRGDYFAVAGKKLYADHIANRPWTYDPKEENKENQNWKIASKGANLASLSDAPKIIEQIANGETIRYHPEVPTFSFWRDQPVFVPRDLRPTAKNMAIVPTLSI
jgi:DNA polymerase type B, organellar and viral